MKFEVEITKMVPHTTVVEIEAKTPKEAARKAIEEAKKYKGIGYFNEWPDEAEYEWTSIKALE